MDADDKNRGTESCQWSGIGCRLLAFGYWLLGGGAVSAGDWGLRTEDGGEVCRMGGKGPSRMRAGSGKVFVGSSAARKPRAAYRRF